MNFDYVRESVETVLSANWTNTPILYENVQSKSAKSSKPSEYIAFRQVHGETFVASLGGAQPRPTSRYTGILRFYIYVQPNTGTNIINSYFTELSDLFQYTRLGADNKLITFDSDPVYVGEADGHYVSYIDIGYSYHEQAK